MILWIFSIGIIFLVIMTILRLCLFFFFSHHGNSYSHVLPALWLGIRFDLRTISILALLLLLLGSIPALDPFKTSLGRSFSLVILFIASFLFFFFYVVDFAHYSYLSQRLNASVLNYLQNTRISLNMVWESYPVIKLFITIILGSWLLFLLIRTLFRRIRKIDAEISRRAKILWSFVFFLLTGLAIFGRIGQFPLRWSDAFSLGNDYEANLALNPFQSFASSMKFRRSNYKIDLVRKSYPLLAPYFGLPTKAGDELKFERTITSNNKVPGPSPNIVVVICESFSAYKSSMWGNPLKTTAFFAELCSKGIFFDRCFSPSYGTARGVWAVISGMPDVEIPSTTSSRNPAAVDQHSLLNDFDGYGKYYFIGGSASWANIRGLLDDNISGLHLYEQEDFKSSKIDVWGISDKNLFLESNNVLKLARNPFFAIIQTADNHRPYSIPKEDMAEFSRKSISKDSLLQFGFETEDEMNAFRYTDFSFKKFMEAAQKEKYFDNTIFLFVGDHGIPGDAGKMFPRAWTDQQLTAEHIPLLIYAPALLQPRRLSFPCSQIDVLPTLAGLSLHSFQNTTLGRNLLDSSYSSRALAFIYDPDRDYIGVIKDSIFYREQLKTGRSEFVSVVDNASLSNDVGLQSKKDEMKHLAQGIYETSKYLLLNNKKKNRP
ncbi:MAG: LTA synthase family protein [Chitinophagales bacterium]